MAQNKPTHKDLEKVIDLFETEFGDYKKLSAFLQGHKHRDELEQHIYAYIKACYDYKELHKNEAKLFYSELRNDFPKNVDFYDYISELEAYCIGNLGVLDRKKLYEKLILANKEQTNRKHKKIKEIKTVLSCIEKISKDKK